MTDPSSASWRRRRRGGKYMDASRRPGPNPLAPDAARRNRDAAFGDTSRRRPWIGAPTETSTDPAGTSADSGPSAAQPPSDPPAESPTSSPARSAPPPSGHGRRAARPTSAQRDRGTASTSPSGASDDTQTDLWALSDEDAAHAGAVEPTGRAEPAAAAGSAPPTGRVERDGSAGRGETTDDHEPRRTDASSSAEEPTGVPGRQRPVSAPAEQSSPSAPEEPAVAASVTDPAPGPEESRPAQAKRPLRRRPEPEESGSLPKVALWTVLTSFLPGSGLVTTRLRRIGWIMLGIAVLVGAAGLALLLFGNPLRAAMMLVTSRNALVGLMIAVGVVGVLWALQVLAANLAQSTKERLEGTKRYIALGVAALMMVAVALPFGRGVQSLWAAQGLLGSETVFGISRGDSRLSTGKDPWAGVGRMNVLLLGQDAGEDRTGTRPDTIMVASIDTESGHTALFSIPRNLEHAQFPEGTAAEKAFPDGFDYFGGQQDLINAVWTWAEDRPDLFPDDPDPGLTATTWAVEETLGLEMDHYAMVNLQGFEDLVDAIGGVDLVVERRIPIGGGASEVEGYIEPGEQKLDGFHALWYARSREGSDDFDRMCRQQRIVRSVSEEADPPTLAMSIPGLVSATEENIVTDIPADDLEAYVDLSLRIKDAGFTSYPITQDVTPSHDPDWEYLKAWTEASIEDSMEQDEPESVLGETEPGSSDPAPTGETPSSDEDTGEDTEQDAPTEEEPTSADGDGEPTADDPEIEQDPLQSCLPGAEEN